MGSDSLVMAGPTGSLQIVTVARGVKSVKPCLLNIKVIRKGPLLPLWRKYKWAFQNTSKIHWFCQTFSLAGWNAGH